MSDSAQGQELPAPHHLYRPAETDSRVVVRFLGNTAQIIDASFLRVDPFQMLALGEWLKYQATKQISMSEMAQAQMGLQVAGKLPEANPFEAMRGKT